MDGKRSEQEPPVAEATAAKEAASGSPVLARPNHIIAKQQGNKAPFGRSRQL
jgi:hypothetical protein